MGEVLDFKRSDGAWVEMLKKVAERLDNGEEADAFFCYSFRGEDSRSIEWRWVGSLSTVQGIVDRALFMINLEES